MNSLELPDTQIEKVTMIEGILIARATGEKTNEAIYVNLRRDLMSDPIIRDLLPSFVRTYRDLGAFWGYIKNQAPSYAERREIIAKAFSPVMDFLEGRNFSPADQATSDALASFDAESVGQIWKKALERRLNDPEGAITMARTLLETVCKRILDELEVEYDERKDDLPALYSKASKSLNLAPNQHSAEPIKAILGGANAVVNGIGTLRNRLSDSHGRGGRLPVRPSDRHAKLAVNMAGAVATFLVETYASRATD